jgi:phosphatidylglycerol:prolipoprotein diacylglycerol transferase
MFPYLPIGPFLLQTPGLALIVGVWIGLTMAEREAKVLKIHAPAIYNLIFFGLVAGIIGARLSYAARFLDVYLDEPLSLFALNTNTIAPVDGLLIGFFVAVIYGWRKQLPLRPTLDALAPGLAVFLVTLGIAHLLSGGAFGAPTKIPLAIYLWDDYRYPTQIFETLFALGVLLAALKRPLGKPGLGLNFLLVVSLSVASRLILEAFRGDSLIWLGGFRAAQVVSLIILLSCLWLIRVWAQPKEFETT